jgi:hypothetical protein
MRTQELESVVVDSSGVLFLPNEQDVSSLDDELYGDDHFFTTLESLVAQGTGPLVVVR